MIKKESLDNIKSNALKRMSWAKARRTNLFINEIPFKRGDTLPIHRRKIEIDRETVMVFADDAPIYNWGHPCRYLLYDTDNEKVYKKIHARFPPDLKETKQSYKPFHEPISILKGKYLLRQKQLRYSDRVGSLFDILAGVEERYAILFSGASNNRHVNDIEFLYRTLIDVYGFDTNKIYILNYDGTLNYSGSPKPIQTWPGDNTQYRINGHINGAGTKEALENVINDLKGQLDRNDFLLIHTNNHGGHTCFDQWPYLTCPTVGEESYLVTQSGPDYLASDFGAKLAELPRFANLMVMMEQCHSGGFESIVINNSTADETSFAAACGECNPSMGGPDFDPFARDWISAVTGVDPYGASLDFDPDTDEDGLISAKEAFDYAYAVKDPNDTPIYNDNPQGCGDDMILGHPPLRDYWEAILKYIGFERYVIKEIQDLIEPKIPPKPPRPGPDPLYQYNQILRRTSKLYKIIHTKYKY